MTGGRRILSVVGARPQFVKVAPVVRALAGTGIEHVLVHTGQHHDHRMSGSFFDDLGLAPPDHDLGVSGGSHADMVGRMLGALDAVLAAERPDAVVVFGDTNSTLAAALAASGVDLPVAHVEAGLRSGDRSMPEERNRVVTDHLSTWLFCPTAGAVANLAGEGIRRGVAHVGDVMYDATLEARRRAAASPILDVLGLGAGGYAVATVHRAANTDDPVRLAEVMGYLDRMARDRPVILPLHPRTAGALRRHGVGTGDLTVTEPLGYLDMTRLVGSAAAVYTDSGGLQKEAYFHRVPCVTLRDTTEWPETIAAGWNRLWTEPAYGPRRGIDEYGDGDAARRIADILAGALAGHRPDADHHQRSAAS